MDERMRNGRYMYLKQTPPTTARTSTHTHVLQYTTPVLSYQVVLGEGNNTHSAVVQDRTNSPHSRRCLLQVVKLAAARRAALYV